MTHIRPFRLTLRPSRSPGALPQRGRRVFGFAFVTLGLGLIAAAAAPMLAGAQTATAIPRDPGVRGGASGAGGPIAGLTANQVTFFNAGLAAFNEIDSVSGTVTGEEGKGLGPRFNMNSCAGCHAQPAVGGTSPSTNPQVAVAHDACSTTCNPEDLSFTFLGGTRFAQPFISSTGPVREARFKSQTNPDGTLTKTPDGGVHDLFTLTGRSDASGCTIRQPDFITANSKGNLVARIPSPTFGDGLIETVQDSTIIDNQVANATTKRNLGIQGHANREGNAGTITRFGWKAQNKSGQIFAGEAYLVEQGVTNELFPNERGEPGERFAADGAERVEPQSACLFNGIPEDHTNFDATSPSTTPSDVVAFSLFMQFLAPPAPACVVNVSCPQPINSGSQLFDQVGCNLCHTRSLQTGKSSVAALDNKTANLFSDLLVHHMGVGLADDVSQGNAGGDEFRSAPLWGVGQRIFFLHDGRTTDLLQAIEQHASTGSEANGVISNFNGLNAAQQQAILNFLRTL
jgi:CxxC motif-containing protein (DUF1111 family)